MSDPASDESPYTASANPESSQSDSRKKEDDQPKWGYAFMVACIAIMIATRGGAIWGALGGGVGGLCLKISQSTNIPLAGRIAACTAITIALWAAIITLVVAVN